MSKGRIATAAAVLVLVFSFACSGGGAEQPKGTGGGISVVTTTEPIPHIALSAAPRLNADVRERIRAALVNAPSTEDGKKMLKGINFERFDPANEQIYAGQGTLLKEYWGY